MGEQGLLCGYWFHDTCERVGQAKYNAISISGEQMHWFCANKTVKDDNKAIKAELATIKTAVGEVSQFKAAISSKPSHEEVNAMKAHTREGQCQTTG